jgi:hypothetical protein
MINEINEEDECLQIEFTLTFYGDHDMSEEDIEALGSYLANELDDCPSHVEGPIVSAPVVKSVNSDGEVQC